MLFLRLSFVLILMLWSGCQEKVLLVSPQTNELSASPPEHVSPGKAQPRLQTLKLWLGPQEITAEIAATAIQVETGLMHRTNMLENEGMLFVFGQPHRASFWMRNTVLPLTCAYIDTAGIVREIHDMKPLDESGIVAGTDEIQYVLEMNKGWFDRNKIIPGVTIRTERGTLRETFFGRR